MAKRVLILGVTGFLGKHLMPFLEGKGYEVLGWCRKHPEKPLGGNLVVGSFSQPEQLADLIRTWQPDFVIHLVSRSKPGRELTEFRSQFDDTIFPSVEVARLSQQRVTLHLFFGSCEEYGNGPTPFRESQAPVCFSPYGWAKIASKIAVEMICQQRNLRYTWIRPFLIFGPQQESDLFIPLVIRSCLNDQKLPLTECNQTRDFIFVRDMVAMIERILANPTPVTGQTVNLCSGQPLRLRNVAQQIQKKIGKGQLMFGEIPYRTSEAMEFFGSNEKFESFYGPSDLTDFDRAIDETIDSYRLEQRR